VNHILQESLDVNCITKFLENQNDNVKYDREQLLCINRYYFKSIDASIRMKQVFLNLKILLGFLIVACFAGQVVTFILCICRFLSVLTKISRVGKLRNRIR